MSFRPDVHRMRGLAIVCIVAGHCMTNSDWRGAHDVERWVGLLARNWTVPFVFIAGYLFRYLDAGADYSAFMRKKARYLLAPYLLCSAPLLIAFVLGRAPEPPWALERWGDLGAGRYAVYLLTGAHARHFWFIPVMFMIFALAPLWRRLERGPRLHVSLGLSVIVSLLVTREVSGGPYPLYRVAHFASCFVFGMWVASYRSELDAHKHWVAPALVLVCGGLVVWLLPHEPKMHSTNYLIKMSLCPMVLWAFDRELPDWLDRGMGRLAELSFGIYFLHVYILDALRGRYTPGTRLRFLSWPGWVWATVLGTASSVLLVLLVRRLAGKWSREVVGVKPA